MERSKSSGRARKEPDRDNSVKGMVCQTDPYSGSNAGAGERDKFRTSSQQAVPSGLDGKHHD